MRSATHAVLICTLKVPRRAAVALDGMLRDQTWGAACWLTGALQGQDQTYTNVADVQVLNVAGLKPRSREVMVRAAPAPGQNNTEANRRDWRAMEPMLPGGVAGLRPDSAGRAGAQTRRTRRPTGATGASCCTPRPA